MSGVMGFSPESFNRVPPSYSEIAGQVEGVKERVYAFCNDVDLKNVGLIGLLFGAAVVRPLMRRLPTSFNQKFVEKSITHLRTPPKEAVPFIEEAKVAELKTAGLWRGVAKEYPELSELMVIKKQIHKLHFTEKYFRDSKNLSVDQVAEDPDFKLLTDEEGVKFIEAFDKFLMHSQEIEKEAAKYGKWGQEVLASLMSIALLYCILSENASEDDVEKFIESQLNLIIPKLENIKKEETDLQTRIDALDGIIVKLNTMIQNNSDNEQLKGTLKNITEFREESINLLTEIKGKIAKMEPAESQPIGSGSSGELKKILTASFLALSFDQRDKLARLAPLNRFIHAFVALKVPPVAAYTLVTITAVSLIQLAGLKLIDPYQTSETIDEALKMRIPGLAEAFPRQRVMEGIETELSFYEQFQVIRDSIPREYVDVIESMFLELVDAGLENKLPISQPILKIMIKGIIETVIVHELEAKYRRGGVSSQASVSTADAESLVEGKLALLNQWLDKTEKSLSEQEKKYTDLMQNWEKLASNQPNTGVTTEPDRSDL